MTQCTRTDLVTMDDQDLFVLRWYMETWSIVYLHQHSRNTVCLIPMLTVNRLAFLVQHSLLQLGLDRMWECLHTSVAVWSRTAHTA